MDADCSSAGNVLSVVLREALLTPRADGCRAGLTSICSAHPVVLEEVLRHGREHPGVVLIEATCNQVNQDGGYTGMRPNGFRRFVEEIADRVGFPRDHLILGGDHLGPHPWRNLPPAVALDRAVTLVAEYVEAGFQKIHLDASMGCVGEPPRLDDETTAERASLLAGAAELATRRARGQPVEYVIGTEVPIPGGALSGLDRATVTTPEEATRTLEANRSAFVRRGLQAAFERVLAMVVHPGVEFGDDFVMNYDPTQASRLTSWLDARSNLVFEAHSTDYQAPHALITLVQDGFAVLKVGPWLTFALREALYGLDHIAEELFPDDRTETLRATMERLMCSSPDHWRQYYRGDDISVRIKRHYSYSDRIRYYWAHPESKRAVARLLALLGDKRIPAPMVTQYLAAVYERVCTGSTPATGSELLRAMIRVVIERYDRATVSRG